MSTVETRITPSKLLISKHKEANYDGIHPASCIRFLKTFLEHMPDDWQNLDRDKLIKKVREYCELNAATGALKRVRMKGLTGYVYMITR